jgi:hypothetical protein
MNKYIILFLLFSIKANAQNIRGFVGTLNEKKMLPYVTISVLNTNMITYSNEKGFFSILCNDSDTLHFSFVGYESVSIPVLSVIKKDSIWLKESNTTLGEIVITNNFTYSNDNIEKNIKTKKKWIGFDKKRKGWFSGIREASVWIENSYKTNLKVNKIRCFISDIRTSFNSDKFLKNNKILVRLRLYSKDKNNMPNEYDILKENIILEIEKNQTKIDFDLVKYDVIMSSLGFFISLEFLGIIKDNSFISYEKLSKEEIAQFNVQFIHSDESKSFIKPWNKNKWAAIGKRDFRFSVELEVPKNIIYEK